MTKQFIIELNSDVLLCLLFILVAAVFTQMLSLSISLYSYSLRCWV